jgi:hypothetical protein
LGQRVIVGGAAQSGSSCSRPDGTGSSDGVGAPSSQAPPATVYRTLVRQSRVELADASTETLKEGVAQGIVSDIQRLCEISKALEGSSIAQPVAVFGQELPRDVAALGVGLDRLCGMSQAAAE